jgi:hypothetical protein
MVTAIKTRFQNHDRQEFLVAPRFDKFHSYRVAANYNQFYADVQQAKANGVSIGRC